MYNTLQRFTIFVVTLLCSFSMVTNPTHESSLEGDDSPSPVQAQSGSMPISPNPMTLSWNASVTSCGSTQGDIIVSAHWDVTNYTLKHDRGHACTYPVLQGLSDPALTPISMSLSIIDDLPEIGAQNGQWIVYLDYFGPRPAPQPPVLIDQSEIVVQDSSSDESSAITVGSNPAIPIPIVQNQTIGNHSLGRWVMVEAGSMMVNSTTSSVLRDSWYVLDGAPFGYFDTSFDGTPTNLHLLSGSTDVTLNLSIRNAGPALCTQRALNEHTLDRQNDLILLRGKSSLTGQGFNHYQGQVRLIVNLSERPSSFCFMGVGPQSVGHIVTNLTIDLETIRFNGAAAHTLTRHITLDCSGSGTTLQHGSNPPNTPAQCLFSNITVNLGGGPFPHSSSGSIHASGHSEGVTLHRVTILSEGAAYSTHPGAPSSGYFWSNMSAVFHVVVI